MAISSDAQQSHVFSEGNASLIKYANSWKYKKQDKIKYMIIYEEDTVHSINYGTMGKEEFL